MMWDTFSEEILKRRGPYEEKILKTCFSRNTFSRWCFWMMFWIMSLYLLFLALISLTLGCIYEEKITRCFVETNEYIQSFEHHTQATMTTAMLDEQCRYILKSLFNPSLILSFPSFSHSFSHSFSFLSFS